jgi:hypothetical protein
MKRVLTIAAIVGLAALASASGAFARSTVVNCPSSPTAAYVSFGVGSEPLVGSSGNVWANGTVTTTLLIYRINAQTFCVLQRDSGTFATVAGPSPGGTGTVAAGIKGSMTVSTVSTVFTAHWKGTAPTSGSLGSYPTPLDWLSVYFDDVQGLGTAYTAGLFQSAAGCWSYKSGGAMMGDVVSARA